MSKLVQTEHDEVNAILADISDDFDTDLSDLSMLVTATKDMAKNMPVTEEQMEELGSRLRSLECRMINHQYERQIDVVLDRVNYIVDYFPDHEET